MGNEGMTVEGNVRSIDRSIVEGIVRRVVCECLQQEASKPQSLTAPCASDPSLFSTPEAEAIKEEICATGRKLWLRQYVDGNGGNISYRIGPNEVLCTPTLISKYDMTPADLCLVDLEGRQLAGTKSRTSEILLHLEIYKEVPEARAVVHCHPPHATAYAITGQLPSYLTIPEFEIFVGPVALSPYETPGTTAFARTVIPYVRNHNTVLLTNHGVVCWGDTVTRAEWYAEVLETYCWTMMLAAQTGAPIQRFTEQQVKELLAIKKTHGLPDIRFARERRGVGRHSDSEEKTSAVSSGGSGKIDARLDGAEIEALVEKVTGAVLAALDSRDRKNR